MLRYSYIMPDNTQNTVLVLDLDDTLYKETGIFQKNKNIFWRFNSAYNQKLYSTFDMRYENLDYYVTDLNKFAPEIINGFVSAIYQLAKYIIDQKRTIVFKPKAIFTTSETLLPIHRVIIEKAFQAKVFNQYASAEGAPFITECVAGKLHYNIDTGIIEPQEDGRMLVTSFTTHGTPLIRYNIGDSITLTPKKKSFLGRLCLW